MTRLIVTLALFSCLCLIAVSCGDATIEPGMSAPSNADSNRSIDSRVVSHADHQSDSFADSQAKDRNVYFGDLHIHSSWSIDAYDAGVRVGPAAAYRYAKGESIPHISGGSIQLAGPPLDFMALTDHAEYLGVIQAIGKKNHPLRSQPLIQTWLGLNANASNTAWRAIRKSFGRRRPFPALVADQVVAPAWQELVTLANRHNMPGVFSALIGFEYSSNPDSQNLHRNILFRGSNVPTRPFSAMDSDNPEDLWDWMDDVRTQGDDLIAIPHNANGSNGLMFARKQSNGNAIDQSWAAQRIRNEPIAEVMQIKGQSETLPVLSPNDEWAAFEMAPWRTLNPARPSEPKGSYVRDALKAGLQIGEQVGTNPYAIGMIGSTDGHNAASPFEEENYTGKIGLSDSTPERRIETRQTAGPSPKPFMNVSTFWSAAGLAGIWADANTRADLFDALRRREAFSTSGPRIRVRFFGGWDFESGDLDSGLGRVGYARGVPMGGTLDASSMSDAPTFLLAALKDPIEGDLERIQIVKGWTEGDSTREQVFDVACAGGELPDLIRHRCLARAKTPDLKSCKPDAQSGTNEFNAWWRDPAFDATQNAFYYVRVLQVPTCRWSTHDANRLGVERNAFVPAAIQERAVTSPIWYVAP